MDNKKEIVWGILRILLGLIFLWAFFDKLLGLGFATCLNAETGSTEYNCDKSWISGGSPTSGFLNFAVKGPFTSIFKSMVGNVAVDWIFMIGLLGIGLTLTFGFAVKIGSISGALMMLLMWLAVLPPRNHPFLDEHIIYLMIFILLIISPPKKFVCNWWRKLKFTKINNIFK